MELLNHIIVYSLLLSPVGGPSECFGQTKLIEIVTKGDVHIVTDSDGKVSVVGIFASLHGNTVMVFADAAEKHHDVSVFRGNVKIISGGRCTIILDDGFCEIERHPNESITTRIKGKSQTMAPAENSHKP